MDKQGSDEKRKLAHDAYTVGWICVLRSELNASRAMLDEEHEPPTPAERDDNSYLLGRMAGHNVVIAFTGSGTYGTNAAAQTATNMIRTFSNIRFGLMVGVGGGAPKRPDLNDPLKDIRLGDVVVSAAKGSHGGVLQYDMGKWKNDNEFRIESHLNKPPKILSKATELLQSHHDFGEGKMTHYINEVAVKSTNLRALRDYRFQGRDQDQLFRPDYPHAGGEDCSTCDATQVEKRLSRESNDPVVHYGLIASGNGVMRSAQRRDELLNAWNVLCFEMEAAGLMDDFPCVVIRGICDYSDDHKHKLWQPYSAVVAAAYAKDLLRVIQPREVENMESAAKMIEKFIDTVIATGETATRIESKLVRVEDIKVLNWLTPIDYAPQHNDFISRRQPGTGQWLLDSAEFQEWLETDKQTLFCPGIPGAGKTIITAIVIDYLQSKFRDDQNTGIAYIYCNFRRQDEQKAENLLGSLLKQLAQRRSSLPASVKDLYDRHKKTQTRPSFDEISVTLHSVAATYSKVFIVVDALDECQISDDNRTRFLDKVFKLQDNAVANIFVTSRPSEISNSFSKGLCRTISATNEDILTYLNAKISLRQSDIIDDEVRDMIRRGVLEAADGMFLLAQLHTETLLSKLTKGHLKQALQALGKGMAGLDRTYDQAMERIADQGHEAETFAKRILAWIIHSKRPLSTLELRHALAVEQSSTTLDADFLLSPKAILSLCAGLVIFDEESSIIRLVHYTTQEYFQRLQKRWFPDAESDITTTCITYLLFDTFKSGFCPADNEFEQRLRSNPLYDYAARNWGHHAREASTSYHLAVESGEARAKVEGLVIAFLESRAKAEASSQAMLVTKLRLLQNYSQDVPTNMTGLHLAAYFGLAKATKALLNNGHRADPTDSTDRTPLSWAAANGHEGAVKLLLENGAQPDLKDKDDQTPLSRAIEGGKTAVVQRLLEKGAKVDYHYGSRVSESHRSGVDESGLDG
ncbi:hypothetical protein DER44DRAFT_903943 [Fusarium oxysporum]|nr:hypothetical protein DER44DRAFT_903943 [Fusarium oxysporum]